jgi:membrane protease YdiL (CAAX protease family)
MDYADENAIVLARYMMIFFIGILLILGLILLYDYKYESDMTLMLCCFLLVLMMFGIWGIYYQNTGKPFLLYDKNTVNMPLQRTLFTLTIVIIIICATYLAYNYKQ